MQLDSRELRFNQFLYAGDIIAPSSFALQKLLNLCSVFVELVFDQQWNMCDFSQQNYKLLFSIRLPRPH